MADIWIENEKKIIEEIRRSKVYEEFRNIHLQTKIEREKQAWELLKEYRGRYSKDILSRVFDTVDLLESKKRWFGSLLAMPNRNLIFESEPELINNWIEELLFSGKAIDIVLNTCLKELKIKGASKGLATLLLYLSDPYKYNIWVNTTYGGLLVLNRIIEFKGNNWGENYIQFNQAAVEFRTMYELQPQEIDWILTFINAYIEESEDRRFLINDSSLEAEQVAIAVDDETDLDDIVGEPMELGVMRWTPTNEMGVVALFIEYRKELGFPFIDFIRTWFPDAAVFENSRKGYIRKYIEFEFKSSGFKSHRKSKRKCHYVVCWEDDWKDCPIPVIELKSAILDILAKR